MHRSLLVFALIAPFAMPPVAGAQSAAESAAHGVRQVTVTGQAQLTATPDRAQVSAGVVTQAPTAAAAVSQNSAAMQGVFDALKRACIAEADVRTAGFSVSPVFDDVRAPRQAPRIVAYQVSNTVTALVRDTGKLGATLDALIAGGANSLHGVSFFVARDEDLQDMLRIDAVKDARRKAAMMAEAAGATLGPVLTITENGRGGGPVPLARMQAEAMRSVPVAAGTETLTMAVTVSFALQ